MRLSPVIDAPTQRLHRQWRVIRHSLAIHTVRRNRYLTTPSCARDSRSSVPHCIARYLSCATQCGSDRVRCDFRTKNKNTMRKRCAPRSRVMEMVGVLACVSLAACAGGGFGGSNDVSPATRSANVPTLRNATPSPLPTGSLVPGGEAAIQFGPGGDSPQGVVEVRWNLKIQSLASASASYFWANEVFWQTPPSNAGCRVFWLTAEWKFHLWINAAECFV